MHGARLPPVASTIPPSHPHLLWPYCDAFSREVRTAPLRAGAHGRSRLLYRIERDGQGYCRLPASFVLNI